MFSLVQTTFSQVNKRYLFNNFRPDATEVYQNIGSAVDTARVGLRLISAHDTLTFSNNLTSEAPIGIGGIGFSLNTNKGLMIGSIDRNHPNNSCLLQNENTISLFGEVIMMPMLLFDTIPRPYTVFSKDTNGIIIYTKNNDYFTASYCGDSRIPALGNPSMFYSNISVISTVLAYKNTLYYNSFVTKNTYSLSFREYNHYIDTNGFRTQWGSYATHGLYDVVVSKTNFNTKFKDVEINIDTNSIQTIIYKEQIQLINKDSINQFNTVTISDTQFKVNVNKTLDVSTANFKPHLYSAATEPDIPTGTQAYWQNTGDSKVYIILDVADTQYKTELSSTP